MAEEIKKEESREESDERKRRPWSGLFEFLKEYSVIGLAIGVIAAQVSKDLIDAIVKNIFMPIINLIVPGDKFRALKYTINETTFDIGAVINAFLTFFIVLLILYIVVKKILRKEQYLKKK